ncbi:MAG: hypothetical protein IAC42_01180 [Spirochaetes bacterium]|uniref:Uncharacterized protein n=1 Tax=Candidatus Aphodenecus pullistercoris TaxID=2840669 RepID=A0A9D9E7K4_9SPIR|nr:hypothetical protein [Candidatus Aphodenecus pullistercoris]
MSFLAVILAGTVLLKLPVSIREGASLSWFDSLFVSTSAVCVTGLTPVILADVFTPVGFFFIALLVQVGGLSFATFAAAFLLFLRRKASSTLIVESYGVATKNWKNLVKVTMGITFTVELLGTIVLFLFFYPYFGSAVPTLGHAAFIAVSAFNNAGFDTFGTSLVTFNDNAGILVTVALLIILGGLGFLVYADLIDSRARKFSIQTKAVVLTTVLLIVFGTLGFWVTGDIDLANSFFQSVTARTAGFESVPQVEQGHYILFLTVILMFIGASPGSTGGGIKTTTFFVVVLTFASIIRRTNPVAFKRRISGESVNKAFAVFLISICIVCLSSLALMAIEEEVNPLFLIYEVVSAYATVGLSCALTPSLTLLSRGILIVLMFVGRVGPLTIAGLVDRKRESVNYIEESMNIG